MVLHAVEVGRLAAHIGGETTDRLWLDGYRTVNIAFQHLVEVVRRGVRQSIVKGTGASEVGLGHLADP